MWSDVWTGSKRLRWLQVGSLVDNTVTCCEHGKLGLEVQSLQESNLRIYLALFTLFFSCGPIFFISKIH